MNKTAFISALVISSIMCAWVYSQDSPAPPPAITQERIFEEMGRMHIQYSACQEYVGTLAQENMRLKQQIKDLESKLKAQ